MNQPLYVTVANSIEADIREGRRSVGDRLPTEAKLSKTYDVSRHTIREALRLLQLSGMVESRRGSGSVVLSQTPRVRSSAWVTRIDDLKEIVASSALDVLAVDRIIVDAQTAETAGIKRGSEWMRISALRQSKPPSNTVVYSRLFINPKHASVIEKLGISPTYHLIEQEFGDITVEVIQRMSVVAAGRDVSSRLNLNANEPIVRVVRTYLAHDGEVLEVAVNEEPASTFSNELRIRRES